MAENQEHKRIPPGRGSVRESTHEAGQASTGEETHHESCQPSAQPYTPPSRETCHVRRQSRTQNRQAHKSARQEKLNQRLEKHPAANELYTDSVFRTIVINYPILAVDVLYALVYGAMGIYLHSPWSGTIAAFYICLSIMRSFILSTYRKWRRNTFPGDIKRYTWKKYKQVGEILVGATIVFTGVLVLLVTNEGRIEYPGYFIYAVATYAFYKIIYMTVQFFRARKSNSAFLSAIRHVGLADALLAILALQSALITSFGEPGGAFALVMNAATGIVVCALILALGIGMILRARNELACLPS